MTQLTSENIDVANMTLVFKMSELKKLVDKMAKIDKKIIRTKTESNDLVKMIVDYQRKNRGEQ